MRILPATMIFMTFAILLSGCGKDGHKGNASIAFNWDWYVDGYNDDNPAVPPTIAKNFNYSTQAGEYNCEYACSDGSGDEWFWTYKYTIVINAGKPGKLFRKGDDGKDRAHKLFLNGLSDPTFSVIQKKGDGMPQKKVKKELSRYTPNQGTRIYHGKPIIEEYCQNEYLITVERRMYTLK
jgi:hypothetical protein